MKRSTKIAISAVVIIGILPVLIVVGAEIVLNAPGIKSKIEDMVSNALEMVFKIEGRIDIRLFPLISLAANNITVKLKSGPIASADQVVIDPRLQPLLNRNIQIKDARIHRARLAFDPHAMEKIAALGGGGSDVPLPVESLAIEAFTISDAGFSYTDDRIKIDVNEMNFKGDRIEIIKNRNVIIKDIRQFFKAMRFRGLLAARQLSVGDFKVENLRVQVKNENGILTADPMELEYLGERAKIKLVASLKEKIQHLQLKVAMPDFNVGRVLKRIKNRDTFNGLLGVKAEFNARGADGRQIINNINGILSMQGSNLTLKEVDIDKALDEFQKMGGYGFNDFAALVTLGPLGTVVSHSFDQLEALEKMMAAKGDSTIRQIVSDWKVSKGVATARDVAFSTQRHRVALAGSIDFPKQRFQDMTIAVIDPHGCIVNKEVVDGSFANPNVKETGVIQRTVIRPLKRFLKTECEAFYSGAVQHPPGAPK